MIFPMMQGGLGRARVSGTWTPAHLAVPPKLWLDDASTVTDAGSGACSQWNDRSSNAWHFTQGTGANRPLIVTGGLNGRRTIRFDGTNDTMINTSSGALDIMRNTGAGWAFVVYKCLAASVNTNFLFHVPNGLSSGNARFSLAAGTAGTPNRSIMNVRRLDADSGVNLNGSTDFGTAWTMALLLMDWANGDGFVYENGALANSNTSLTSTGSTSNTASLTAIALGASGASTNHADSEVASIIVGAGSLPSSDEIDRLFGRAAHRYGLAANLPNGHPFKAFAP
jgi:hypothetical protein